MSLGFKNLLPSDCLNITEFWEMHVNTHSDAHEYSFEQELLHKFHNFGGEYQFAFKFACLTYLQLPKEALYWHFNCMG